MKSSQQRWDGLVLWARSSFSRNLSRASECVSIPGLLPRAPSTDSVCPLFTPGMTMDETLYAVADRVQNYAVIYLVDINIVPDFNKVRSRSVESMLRDAV